MCDGGSQGAQCGDASRWEGVLQRTCEGIEQHLLAVHVPQVLWWAAGTKSNTFRHIDAGYVNKNGDSTQPYMHALP